MSVRYSLCLLATLFLNDAFASDRSTLFQSSEVNEVVNSCAADIWRVAGLGKPKIVVHLVITDDDRKGLLLLDQSNLYVTIGYLLSVSGPDALRARLAHEAAHVAGGHFGALLAASKNAQSIGAALVSRGYDVFDKEGRTSAERKSQEYLADQVALTYLKRAGYSAAPLKEELEKQKGETTPDTSLHPDTTGRLQKFVVDGGSGSAKLDVELVRRFTAMHSGLAKLDRKRLLRKAD